MKKTFLWITFLLSLLLFTQTLRAVPSSSELAVMDIVDKIEAAYARVEGYQTDAVVNEYREGRVVDTKRFRYTFKKPHYLRIDMESPHRGMILIFPDKHGKVIVRPGSLGSFMKLHLAPDNVLLRTSAGQRIDQTDLGLLIHNIRQSVAGGHGIKVSQDESRVRIEVLADDHFQPGVLTLYRFTIDKTNWLPAEVQEFTPDGVPKRTIIFHSLRIVQDIPNSYFRINEGN